MNSDSGKLNVDMKEQAESKIRAVVFDWGGVLIENPVDGILSFVEQHFPGLGKAPYEGEAMRFFQEGKISENEFWEELAGADELDLSAFDGSLWRKAFEHTYTERVPVVRLAKTLKEEGYITAMLSNTEAPAVEMLKAMNYDCFDHGLYSCELGIVKPEPEIYRRCIELLGVQPNEMLFIDDKVENIEAAEALGIRGHIMDDFAGLDARLEALRLPRLEL